MDDDNGVSWATAKIMVGKAYKQGIADCIKRVKARQQHYESYRCNCGREENRCPTEGHAAGCKAEMMMTRPATFAALEEILVFLEALHEKPIDYQALGLEPTIHKEPHG